MKRPTIADVAKRAGVTKAAVSFALNNQPGVSAATRERILAIAAEVGFQPSSAARAGIEITSAEADYSGASGAHATRDLLSRSGPPTAIIYDSDVMAVAGLGEAQRLGIEVPAGLSIVAWDDSALCELVHPALTALRHDVAGVGAEAARRLCRLADGTPAGGFAEPPPMLMARASAARPAPRAPFASHADLR